MKKGEKNQLIREKERREPERNNVKNERKLKTKKAKQCPAFQNYFFQKLQTFTELRQNIIMLSQKEAIWNELCKQIFINNTVHTRVLNKSGGEKLKKK